MTVKSGDELGQELKQLKRAALEAQDELQILIGFIRLRGFREDIDEDRLVKVLAWLHSGLKDTGHEMYNPETHPEVPYGRFKPER